MKANTKHNSKVAGRFHNTGYYESNEFNTLNQETLASESSRLRTDEKEKVTEVIEKKRKTVDTEGEKVFMILKSIYEKNKKHCFGYKETNEAIHTSDLLSIVSSVPLLMVSYAKVRKNSGSTSLAYHKDEKDYEKLDPDQKNLINKNDKGADGINIDVFKETSRLLKRGKYPWGTSKRITIDKPGKPGAKRPLTIPPFMDRVVQEAIRQTLVPIYEPIFDKMNVSFGFRPNRSAQDAIYTLTNRTTEGLDKALEGDIKSAYDKVNRKKLIEILGKRIKDRKFLNLIEDRLNYDYYDMEKDIYVKDKDGIPQGGTDSPYLWNIYMLEFDIFITEHISNIIEEINVKTRGLNSDKKKITNNERSNYSKSRATIQKILSWIRSNKNKYGTFKEDLIKLSKMNLLEWKNFDPIFKGDLKNAKTILKECDIENVDEKTIIKNLQEKQRKITHRMNNMPFLNINKKRLRIIYTRYADDWIILTNIKTEMLKNIKEKISNFLNEELHATLSDEKTLITNIEETPAHFLGFEIRTYKQYKIGKKISASKDNKKKIILAKIAGNRVFAGVDKQRLIDRLHMKGYCDKNGFPREITKLSNLEPFTIIERTNSVLMGLTNYYVNSIKNPKSELSRWIYVIRFSCLKTLALKYKTTLRNIFTKFRPEINNSKHTDTIEDTVTIEIKNERFSKTWRLNTIQTLMEKCRSKNQQLKRKEIKDRFWSLRENIPPEFSEKKKGILIDSNDFLERINWVNIRTKASFDLPCCICGCEENIEMHHVKHVRKTKYTNLDKSKPWELVMGLRNRRQIPVCRFCHMNVIHKGKYGGKPLADLSVDKLYDNRIVNSESYIHKGKLDVDYKKTLIDKGWRKEKESDQESDTQ